MPYSHSTKYTYIPFVRWVLHELGVAAAAFQSLNITCNLLPTARI